MNKIPFEKLTKLIKSDPWLTYLMEENLRRINNSKLFFFRKNKTRD